MGPGGAERVAALLANAWVERGYAVTLVVTYAGGVECFYPLSRNVRLLFLANLGARAGRGALAYWTRLNALRSLIAQLRPDVVVSFLSRVNIAAVIASAGLRNALIVCERTFPPSFPLGRIWELLRRVTYPRASRVVMVSSEGLNWLESHIPSAKGVHIPNPVVYPLPGGTPVVAPEHVIQPHRKVLLAVGRLDRGKQFDRLLKSFANLATDFSEWDLVIVGDGPERARLEQQALKLNLTRRTVLLGPVGNLGDWYRRADLFVMSSRFEGFPNSLAEAMAHGCTAVSYDCDTGPRDIIRHGVDGLLVGPVGDVKALTQALRRLIANDVERARFAARAVEIRERFSMERILGMWDALFESVSVPTGTP